MTFMNKRITCSSQWFLTNIIIKAYIYKEGIIKYYFISIQTKLDKEDPFIYFFMFTQICEYFICV